MFKRVRNKILRIALIVVYFFMFFTCAFQISFLGLFGSSPTTIVILLPELDVSSELFTADSVFIGRSYLPDRDPVPYVGISPHIVHAFFGTEDGRVRTDHGV